MSVRGLYPILGDAQLAPARFAHAAETLAGLGVEVMQLRMKTLADREAVALHEAVADRLARWPGLLVINDRADLALLSARRSRAAGHAHSIGLHLGQTDLPPAAARAIVGHEVAIGLSTHSLEQLRAALDAPRGTIDHVAFGPIFSTQSKAEPDPVVGLAGLEQAAALVSAHARPLPLVAIGGIDLARVAHVRAAGASAVAVIGALFGADEAGLAARGAALLAALATADRDRSTR